MKKISLILLCGIILLGICGCGTSKFEKTLQEEHYGFGWGNDYNEEGLVCEEIKDAISLDNNYFLTSTGDLYKFNGQKLFSNDKNCIKTDYGNSNLAFILNSGIYNKNHELTYIINEDKEIMTPQEYKDKYNSDLYVYNRDIIFNEDYDFIASNGWNEEIITIKDNIIYYYDKNNQKQKLGEIPKDEKILYLGGGNVSIIKTDKAYWSLKITNEEECTKYVDRKCNVSFVKSSLTDIYDKIIFANGDLLVDNQYYAYGRGKSIDIQEILN